MIVSIFMKKNCVEKVKVTLSEANIYEKWVEMLTIGTSTSNFGCSYHSIGVDIKTGIKFLENIFNIPFLIICPTTFD